MLPEDARITPSDHALLRPSTWKRNPQKSKEHLSPQYPYGVNAKPRDDRGLVQDAARDLAEIAAHLGALKGEANV
jgi:hypothetical protein